MNLSDYDGKCVRITDTAGNVYDGICEFDSAEYCEHAFGRREAALEIMDTLFFAGDIESVEVLTDVGGEFGCFRDAYGRIEEQLVADGAGAICDALEDAALGDVEPLHAARLIRCLAAHPEAVDANVLDAIRSLAESDGDGEVRQAARDLIDASGDEGK